MQYFLLDTKDGKEKAIENIKSCPESYVCTIEPRKRTVEQNRLYWAILKEISEQHAVNNVKYRESAWHEILKKAFLPSKLEKLPDETEMIVYKSTTKLNKEEFSNYILDVESFCRESNIVIDHLLEDMPYAKPDIP